MILARKGALLLLLLPACCRAQQGVGVSFPDSLKKPSYYYSPYTLHSVSPAIIGAIKPGEPFDSTNSESCWKFIWSIEFSNQVDDSVANLYSRQAGLRVMVDTAQEITQQEQFLKTFRDGNKYASPRYVVLMDKQQPVKRMPCRHDTMLNLKYRPVYILNPTGDTKKILNQDFILDITQEALDKNGQWQAIESLQGTNCGMARGWSTLQPGQMVITAVPKYNGGYKTLGRVKFDNGAVYYSEPYAISINPDVLAGKVKTVAAYRLFEIY